jgi:hypothetical protein
VDPVTLDVRYLVARVNLIPAAIEVLGDKA